MDNLFFTFCCSFFCSFRSSFHTPFRFVLISFIASFVFRFLHDPDEPGQNQKVEVKHALITLCVNKWIVTLLISVAVSSPIDALWKKPKLWYLNCIWYESIYKSLPGICATRSSSINCKLFFTIEYDMLSIGDHATHSEMLQPQHGNWWRHIIYTEVLFIKAWW